MRNDGPNAKKANWKKMYWGKDLHLHLIGDEVKNESYLNVKNQFCVFGKLYFSSHSSMSDSACSSSFRVIFISRFTVLSSLCKLGLMGSDSSFNSISVLWEIRMSSVSMAFLYCDLYRLQGVFIFKWFWSVFLGQLKY